ncbi:hypothetical protein HK105_201935 [Polyrhizophydium stewartii]|uniref:START domain-containing protein n=1 Tax=Polyrhizophydium stewartii TaxID=2732419 RepID=A0ABR4NG70_9FUNG
MPADSPAAAARAAADTAGTAAAPRLPGSPPRPLLGLAPPAARPRDAPTVVRARLPEGFPEEPAAASAAPAPDAAPAGLAKSAPAAPAAAPASAAAADPYIAELAELTKKFVDLCDLDAQPVGAGTSFPWQPIIEQSRGNFAVQVHQRTGHDVFFRVVVDVESTPEEAFDLLADISSRSAWDDICVAGGVVEELSPVTKIQYMRTRGMWPTAPRDALVVAFVKRLNDGRYLNVTRSVDSHPNYKSQPGDVRMLAHLAGVIVGPHPSKPGVTRCFQLVDGDLGGWLPKSVVSVVTTQAFPISMRKVNKILRGVQSPRTTSLLIQQAEAAPVAAPASGTAPASSIAAPAAKPATPAGKPAASGPSAAVVQQSNGAVVGAAAPASPLGILKMVLNALAKAQPVLVLFLFIDMVLRRRRA